MAVSQRVRKGSNRAKHNKSKFSTKVHIHKREFSEIAISKEEQIVLEKLIQNVKQIKEKGGVGVKFARFTHDQNIDRESLNNERVRRIMKLINEK
jgi:hypothetical protein